MATSCKDAIKLWEQAEGKVAAEAEDVRLCPISLQAPIIQKMDNSLSQLKKCKHLRLSTNSIDKITGLNGMEQLQILSLGRNQIKRIEGLEASLAASKKEGASLQAALEGARAAGSKLEVQLAAASERFARQVRVRMRRVRMRQGHARHAACASS